MLQQEEEMNLYSFNKVSWCTGYDNKGQHFEKWRSATASVYSTNRIDVETSKRTCFAHYIGC